MEEKPGDKGGKHQIHHKGGRGGPHPPSVVKDQLTNVAHFCILAYVLLICYLCLKQPLDMFTWHPLLLSIGWMFLMVEGTLLISKENIVTRKLKLSHTKKERYHWIFFTVGAVLIAAGFLVVYRRKNSLNKSHFQSWHAIFGLIGIAAYFFPCLNGIPLLYRKELKNVNYIKMHIVKLIHLSTGIISLTFGGISLILGLYSKWFIHATNSNKYVFYFAVMVTTFPLIWTIQRPLIKCLRTAVQMISGNKDEKRK